MFLVLRRMGVVTPLFFLVALQWGRSGFLLEDNKALSLGAFAQTLDAKETLRGVFHIPPTVNRQLVERSVERRGKHLEYMHRLYKKVTSGQLTFPKYSNTIRTITAKTDDVIGRSPTRAPGGRGSNASLLYDLSTRDQERIVMAALHLTGHRELHRPRRLLLSLVGSYDAGGRWGNNPSGDPPLMTVFVKKFPKEVDLTNLVQRALQSAGDSPKQLKIQIEQLRGGKWTPYPSRRLVHNPPFLVVFSGDLTLIDTDMSGQSEGGAADNSHLVVDSDLENAAHHVYGNYSESFKRRRRRAIEENNSILSNEIPSFQFNEISSPDNTLKLKTNFWNLDESGESEEEEKDEEIFSYNDEMDNEIPLNVVVTNEDPKTNDDRGLGTEIRGSSDQKTEANKGEIGTQETVEDDKDDPFIAQKTSDVTTFSVGTDEDFWSDSNFLPSSDKNEVEKKSSKKRKSRKKFKSNGGLLPSPEYYAKWDKWQNTKTNKRRKNRNKKRFKKSKKRRAKGIPTHWFHLSSSLSRVETEGSKALNDDPSSAVEPCRRKEFSVDFRVLGWQDFLIAPLEFNTFYCEGFCSSPLDQSRAGTNHALVQSLLRVMMKDSKLPEPCCVPGKMDSLTFLMLDENGRLTLRTIPNMVVKSCTCQ